MRGKHQTLLGGGCSSAHMTYLHEVPLVHMHAVGVLLHQLQHLPRQAQQDIRIARSS